MSTDESEDCRVGTERLRLFIDYELAKQARQAAKDAELPLSKWTEHAIRHQLTYDRRAAENGAEDEELLTTPPAPEPAPEPPAPSPRVGLTMTRESAVELMRAAQYGKAAELVVEAVRAMREAWRSVWDTNRSESVCDCILALERLDAEMGTEP